MARKKMYKIQIKGLTISAADPNEFINLIEWLRICADYERQLKHLSISSRYENLLLDITKQLGEME